MLINKDKLINNEFERHVNLMVKTLVSNIQGIDSIILYGSYGRGEGAWIKSNGSYNPYNDYDVLIVLIDKAKKPKNISSIKEDLLKKINIKWIDLSFIHLTSLLKNKSKSIFQYDLIHGSKVIFGNFNLLKKIPKFNSSEINLNEGKLLFYTRLWPFVGGAKLANDLHPSEARFFRYQMAKVILASLDMMLLMRGLYESSYVKRCDIATLICEHENLLDKGLFLWAIEQKLNPSNDIMDKNQVIKLQSKVAQLFSKYGLKILSKRYNKKFTSVEDFERFYANSIVEKFKIFAGFVLRKKINYKKIRIFNMIQMLVLSNILGEIHLDHTLYESNKLLRILGFSTISDLNTLRELIASERLI